MFQFLEERIVKTIEKIIKIFLAGQEIASKILEFLLMIKT